MNTKTALYPDRKLAWPIVWPAVELIAEFEGCRLDAYRDLGGRWTIGWGSTMGVKRGDSISQAEADRLFLVTLRGFVREVQSLLRDAPATTWQLSAMVSLAYNIGTGAFGRSSILRAHLRGDYDAAARAFSLYNKATINGRKQVVRGLTRRRAAEAAMYLREPVRQPALPARSVEAESRMTQSPLAQSGAVSAATGALAVASAAAEDIGSIQQSIGFNPLLVIGLVSLAVGGVVLFQRLKQRREGWA